MRNKKRILTGIIVIGVIAAMAVLGFGALSPDRSINEEKSFAAGEIGDIQVKLSSEPVHVIKTAAGGDIRFHLHGQSKRTINLVTEQKNNTVFAEVRRVYNALPINEELYLDVYIPENYGRDLSIKTSSGIIKLDALTLADLKLEASSGGLEAEGLTAGTIDIKTSSGKVSFKETDAGELRVIGSSASILIDCAATGNISIKTTSGHITLVLPGTSAFSYDIATTSGRIDSDFPMNQAEKHKIAGQNGIGNAVVSLQATSGRIELLKK